MPIVAPRAIRSVLSPGVLQALILVAGLACCVAMSMPQVHIVAYCGDLGYGVARGAEMLSLMLGFGIISRIGSGFIADRIGGLATMLLGSALQASALLLYLLVRWSHLALCDLGVLRPVAGRHRPDVCRDRARFLCPAGSRHACWASRDGHHCRHGVRGLAVRGHFRPDGIVRPGASAMALPGTCSMSQSSAF